MDWTILISIIGGGAFLSFIEYLIKRHDEKKGKTNKIMEAIEKIQAQVRELKKENDDDRATNARIRILKFSDEVRHGVRHSKEAFDQVNQDIDIYNAYCKANPSYENNRGVQAIENIERIYQQCLRDNDFLI